MKNFIKRHWLDFVVLLYILSPIDVIPDSIPLLGTTDDAFLVLLDIIRTYYLEKRLYDDDKTFSKKIGN